MKKLISLILASCLVFSLAACGSDTPSSSASSQSESASPSSSEGETDPTGPEETYALIAEQTDLDAVAAKTAHFSFTKGEIAYYYALTYRNYYQYFTYFGIDPSKSLKEQKYSEDKTWFDVFLDEALNYAKNYLTYCEAAEDRGLELDEDDKEYIASQKTLLEEDAAAHGWDKDTYIAQMFGTNITWDILEAAMQKMLLADKGYSALNDELRSGISENDIQAQYESDKKKYDLIDYVDINFLDAEAMLEEDKAELVKAFKEAKDEASFTKAVILFVDKAVDEEKITEAGSSVAYAEKLIADGTRTMAPYNQGEMMDWAFSEDRQGDVYVQAEAVEGAQHAYLLKAAPHRDDSTYVNVRHILFLTESHETAEKAREKAEEIYAQWQAGDKTEDSFAELAVSLSEDGGSAQNGGLYENVYRGQMVEPFENWCFDSSRKTGDTGIVDTTYGSHIMYFVSSDTGWHMSALNDLMNKSYTAAFDELSKAHPIDVDSGVVNAINW